MRYLGLAVAAVVCFASLPIEAAPTAEQTAKATAADEALKEAAKLIIGKKHEDAVPLVEQAQSLIVELQGGNGDAKKLAGSLEGRFAAAKRSLESKGLKIAEPPKPGTPPTPGAGGISFTKEIVPILVGRCNNCHIAQTRGGFSMANYSALMKGSQGGRVVNPGKGDGSRLVEVLDSGDMPRGGGKLADAQIALISKWIDQGAKFDGRDPTANITTGAPAPAQAPQLQVTKATGNESVLFARDIAPVLAENCIGCHGNNQPRANLGLDTFARMLAGSNNNNTRTLVITPGKGADSLIVKKLKGQAGARMPLNRPALTDEVIAKFEKWINEGAKYDGSDSNMNVDMVAKVYRASVMSHDELAKERVTVAMKNWQLANPDDRPERSESDSYLVLGNVSEDEVAEVQRLAELQQPKVARILKGPTSGPLVKGRVTFFVFRKRYDYSELGRMVEQRELPSNWFGHWRYNVIDAYAGIVMPQGSDVSLNGLVAEQLAGVYLDSLSKDGKLPAWFSQGTAWAVAASLDAKDPRVRRWEESVPRSGKPDDFLTGNLPPAETFAANYSFCKYLMGQKGFSVLLASLKDKKDFNESFMKAFGAEPKALAPMWARAVVSRR